MKTSAWLPVGTKENHKDVLVSKGDILELVDGDRVTFTEMKRVRFVGQMTATGKGISVPIYRNNHTFTPYVVKVTGEKDKKVTENQVKPTGLKYGNLFALEGHKETFMFVGTELKRGTKKLVGIDLATSRRFTISPTFTLVKVNVPKIKKSFPINV
jgi:hypothetical protein